MREPCTGCGLVLEGGTAACQGLFQELIARDFSDVLYFAVHRLAVDAYALQHPERYGRSAKSLAAHLTGVCCAMEHDGSPEINAAVQRWLNGRSPISRPEVPAFRGAMTIADVLRAPDPAAHADAVRRWARSTWEAWSALHPLARRWIAEATRGASA